MAVAHENSRRISPDDLAQRLERVERKLDSLLALERLSDLQWRGFDPCEGNKPATESDRFEALTASFVGLLDQRKRLVGAAADAIWVQRDGAARQLALDGLADQLLAVAGEIAETPVSNLAEVRIKALALQELAEENSDDIVHRLALSLAADLFALKDAG